MVQAVLVNNEVTEYNIQFVTILEIIYTTSEVTSIIPCGFSIIVVHIVGVFVRIIHGIMTVGTNILSSNLLTEDRISTLTASRQTRRLMTKMITIKLKLDDCRSELPQPSISKSPLHLYIK